MFLELFLFSCIPTIPYQLIAKSMCEFEFINALLFLWSVKPFYSGMTRRNKLRYFIHLQDWVKAVVICKSNANPAFDSVLPWSITVLCQECHENCTTPCEFLTQWYSLPSLFIPWFPFYCNRNADKWIVMCEINTPRNCVAWYLTGDNSILSVLV